MSPGHFPRNALIGIVALLATMGTAYARTPAVPCSNVGFDVAILDALMVAMQKPGRMVVRMDGDSMLPFFGSNTIGVVQQIPVAKLRLGMIAVYTNFLGEKVAHRVVAKRDHGWTVKGYNNSRADSTVVNASNLLGVLYATFDTSGSPSSFDSPAIASLPSLDLVLGAPAK